MKNKISNINFLKQESLVPAFFTSLIEKLWFDITLMLWGLVNLNLHNHWYFYWDTISRKVKYPNLTMRHGYYLPDANPVFQYHEVPLLMGSDLIICLRILKCWNQDELTGKQQHPNQEENTDRKKNTLLKIRE